MDARLALRRAALTGLLALLVAAPAFAQTPDSTEASEEAILETLGEDEGAGETAALDLEDLRMRPLDLNTASVAELSVIPVLSGLLAPRIVAYRQSHAGGFRSLPELQQVEGVTDEIYDQARPFLTIGAQVAQGRETGSLYPQIPRWEWVRSNLKFEGVQRYGRRLGTSRAETDSVYLGSPDKVYTRLRLTSRRWFSATLTMEKDAGEPFRLDAANGFYGYDHITGSVAINNFGRLERAVVGDFTASFGQGLLLWRAGGYGKSREATRGVARFGNGLQAFSSTEENRFFRGGGAAVRITPRLTLTAFGSLRTLDATLTAEDSTDVGIATSFGTSGLHRTDAEIARKDALGQTLGGGALVYRFQRAELGVAGLYSAFDRSVDPGTDSYRRYAFRGDRYAGASAFGHLYTGPALFFGEVAVDDSAKVAGTGGVQIGLGRTGEFVLAVRSFDKAFVSLNGEAFGERSGNPANEQGLYAATRVNLTPTMRLSGYADLYRFPWLRYGVARPTAGLDALVSFDHAVRRYLSYYLLVRSETREEGASYTNALGQVFATTVPETRESVRLHGEYVFSRRLTLKARVEAARFRAQGESWQHGYVLYQDVRVVPVTNLQLDFRIALFNTDGYDARIYTYENDVRGGFSVPALSGQGTRMYALARYLFLDRFTLEARVSQTRFEDVTEVGSGLDAIPGNTSRDVRVQLTARF